LTDKEVFGTGTLAFAHTKSELSLFSSMGKNSIIVGSIPMRRL